MNLRTLLPLALASALALLAPACSPEAQAASDPAAVQHEPTPERLKERVLARWDHVVRNDWIGAFAFMTPEQKRAVPIERWLNGKQNHRYENARVFDVLTSDPEEAYVRVGALWTPVHPALKDVELPEGYSLTRDIELYEVWRFVDGDWHFIRSLDDAEFFRARPEFLRTAARDEPERKP